MSGGKNWDAGLTCEVKLCKNRAKNAGKKVFEMYCKNRARNAVYLQTLTTSHFQLKKARRF